MNQEITTTNVEFAADFMMEWKKSGGSILVTSNNGVLMKIEVITDHVIRFRYSTTSYFEKDFSYAIDSDNSSGYTDIKVEEYKSHLEIRTPKIICRVVRHRMLVHLYDSGENLLCADEKGFHWEENEEYGGNIVQMSKVAQKGEHYYGLGDKATKFNLRDKRLENWGSDIYGYETGSDPLYKNIPFYIGMHKSKCYGIFFDNTYRSYFDFAHERKAVTSFWAEGGEMNYYFIYGSDMLKVSERYTRLTGRPELPPLWALGYHQCKWSYYPDKKVEEIAHKFRELNLPCDAIYLDIDYMDAFKCFTWHPERFPHPKKLVDKLSKDGFKTVVIIDPGIKIEKGYHVYEEALEKDLFCKRADGPLMKGKVWPGECYFPDYTNPEAREWWADLFEELIQEVGVKGVWNDMNEPALFEIKGNTFPNDVRHDFDGHPCSHRKAHNIYGMQMSRATYEGVKKYAFPHRPFIITRSTFSGGQKYSSVWTGDNIASWDHLWLANIQMQRLAICGFSFAGSDIGGFIEHPESELYIRWMQLAVFHPFMRTHSSGDHGNQEPWSFGEDVTDIVGKFINLRYKLLPYLYTAFYQYVHTGTPILRPISFFDIKDENAFYREDEFLFGDNLLVCPILKHGAEGRRMYLPKGTWHNYWTHELIEGGKELWVEATVHEIPLFVRPGSVIPMYPVMNYVGEKEVNVLDLHVYYKEGKNESTLFEDRGDGYDYKRGYYNEKVFKFSGKEKSIQLRQHISGQFEPTYKHYKLVFYGLPFVPSQIVLDDETNIPFQKNEEGKYEAIVPVSFVNCTVK